MKPLANPGTLRRTLSRMQWYFASLAWLGVLVTVGTLTGALVIAPLPARMQPGARIFLCLPLGWSLLTLVATLLGWFGHGFAGRHCAVITLALSVAGAWAGRRWLWQSCGDAVRLAAFCIIASFPFLGPLLLYGSFSNYNDTFIYISQAQWLQAHGFLEHARTDGGHPAWATVQLFQNTSLRMGSAFVLGWVQAMFGREWSYDVFPLVSALGVICGALGIGATLLAACPSRWLEAWLAALTAAVTVNGFAFGAAEGFLPQTWGLACAATAFGLRGLELGTRAEKSGGARWRTGVPIGIGVAASMHCYWDLLPLEGPALGMTYLLPWPGWKAPGWRRIWGRAWVPALSCLLLVNLEWLRAIPGILGNVKAVVANPVPWQLWDFPAHALGLKSSVWEGSRWIWHDASPLQLLGGCVGVMVWLTVMRFSLRSRRLRRWTPSRRWVRGWQATPLLAAAVWVTMSGLLFVYFRYFVASPWRMYNDTIWPDGIGQSWSQYKLTIWASFAVICLVTALGTAWTMRAQTPWRRSAVIVILLIWCGTGLGWNYRLAWRRGKWMLQDVAVQRDPFAACLAMRNTVAALPPNEWVYLDWPTSGHVKFRQVIAYFLCDHPLASDWKSDAALGPYITPDDARRTAADCQWILRYRPSAAQEAGDKAAQPPGVMTLDRVVR